LKRRKLKMKTNKNKNSAFKKIWNFFDRHLIIPITKIILFINEQFDVSGKRFEKWLSNSTTILFVSLFIAVYMFIAVDQNIISYSENSATVLKNQPVIVQYNEEAYVIEGVPDTVDITLIGSKANLYFAEQTPSQGVVLDLSGLKPGSHEVDVAYNKVLPSIEYSVNPSAITVNIYSKISETRTLTKDILNQDSIDETLIIDNIAISTDKVVIKGAEKDLEIVANVKALVDMNNIVEQAVGETVLTDIPLRAYDENGSVVDIEIVPETVDAVITITSPSKEVPIELVPTGEVSFGLAINAIIPSATKVTLYGDEEILNNITSVEVLVDVSDLKENKTFKLELPTIVGVKSMNVKNINVEVSLDKSAERELDGISIDVENLDDDLKVQGVSGDDTKVAVSLVGVQSVIDAIQPADVKAYLDLSGLSAGTHEVNVQVSGEDSRVIYSSKTTKVNIIISKK
jgi:YbbR domain-containing protein